MSDTRDLCSSENSNQVRTATAAAIPAGEHNAFAASNQHVVLVEIRRAQKLAVCVGRRKDVIVIVSGLDASGFPKIRMHKMCHYFASACSNFACAAIATNDVRQPTHDKEHVGPPSLGGSLCT